jgi:hypothetical protein
MSFDGSGAVVVDDGHADAGSGLDVSSTLTIALIACVGVLFSVLVAVVCCKTSGSRRKRAVVLPGAAFTAAFEQLKQDGRIASDAVQKTPREIDRTLLKITG